MLRKPDSTLTQMAPSADGAPNGTESPGIILSDRQKLRIVLLGAGRMARHHAKAIAALSTASVVGFADPSSSARTEMQKILPDAVANDDPSSLLAKIDADVAHVCTPPDQHFTSAHAALDAGLHVYVEKPFVSTAAEAGMLLDYAAQRRLRVCAGHQLLFEPGTREALTILPALRQVVHIESYFSFRTVRRTPDGKAPLDAQLQLLDILPHPVYLLVRFLEAANPGVTPDVEDVRVGPRGTIHAFLRSGAITGTLVVTLDGRPIESYVRLVGTNGSIVADYVRGTTQRLLGPGISGIDKVLNPYRLARQLMAGTTRALAKRFAGRRRSYPALRDAFGAFYDSIRESSPPPISATNILATTRICEQVGQSLKGCAPKYRLGHRQSGQPVIVTGGTGFLGRRLVQELRERGRPVTVLARRIPPAWERASDVSYAAVDLSGEIDSSCLAGAEAIVHCAAATSGGWDAHEKNSLAATRNLLEAAAASGVTRVIHVSSLAVQPPRGRDPIKEDTPLADRSKQRGPYAWGKTESERLAREWARKLGIDLKVARPGALVDYGEFEAPGRLGRGLGRLFVAVGSPSDKLGTCELALAARTLARMALEWTEGPATLNLLQPDLPTKKELVTRLRKAQPDTRIVWLPRWLLAPVSVAALLVQKLLRPKQPAINVARIFAKERYDTTAMRTLAREQSPDA